MATAIQAIDDSSASVFLNDSVCTAPTKPAIPRTAPKKTSPLRDRVAALEQQCQAEADLDQAERGGVVKPRTCTTGLDIGPSKPPRTMAMRPSTRTTKPAMPAMIESGAKRDA